MNYTIVRNPDTGKITDLIMADGKSITVRRKDVSSGKSFMKALTAAQETTYWKEYSVPTDVYNMVSGISRELQPLEASIAKWVLHWYRLYSLRGDPRHAQASIQTFDNMKYLLLHLDAEAYYDLID